MPPCIAQTAQGYSPIHVPHPLMHHIACVKIRTPFPSCVMPHRCISWYRASQKYHLLRCKQAILFVSSHIKSNDFFPEYFTKWRKPRDTIRFNASCADVSAVTHIGFLVMISATVVALEDYRQLESKCCNGVSRNVPCIQVICNDSISQIFCSKNAA